MVTTAAKLRDLPVLKISVVGDELIQRGAVDLALPVQLGHRNSAAINEVLNCFLGPP